MTTTTRTTNTTNTTTITQFLTVNVDFVPSSFEKNVDELKSLNIALFCFYQLLRLCPYKAIIG